MMNKLKGRPVWYQTWTLLTVAAAAYTVAVFGGALLRDSFAHVSAMDYFLAALVQLSLLLDLYLFPKPVTKDG